MKPTEGVTAEIVVQHVRSLIERGETFVAYTDRGYWIDIGTRQKYRQVHRDIMDGRYQAPPFSGASALSWIAPDARVEDGAQIEGPCFIDEGTVIRSGARVGPYSVIGRHCHIEEKAEIDGAIIWPNSWVGAESKLSGCILGRHTHIGRAVTVGEGAVLGDKSVLTDYTGA